MTYNDHELAARILADKISLLLDTLRTESGDPYNFITIQQGLKERGVVISRTKWHYLKSADTRVRADETLLRALGEVFGVDPRYLVHVDGPLPQQVEQELHAIRSLRRAEVRNFAARALGQIDPEGLNAILKVIEDSGGHSTDPSH